MYVPNRRKKLFHQEKPRSNPYRILLFLALIAGGVWILIQQERGEIVPLFLPTQTPTRSAASYAEEARALFEAGILIRQDHNAISAYREALRLDPDNPQLLAEKARAQTYASSLRTPDRQLTEILEAETDIRHAAELAPEDSTVLAIMAFVLDWKASLLPFDQQAAVMAEADTAASRALVFDSQNPLALAYYAEVLIDQLLYDRARQNAELAVELGPDLMDTHRVYAYVLESSGAYAAAIGEYEKAAQISPNLTFLYIKIGQNYRQLGLSALSPTTATIMYDKALEYFDRAATINASLGIPDPLPYRAIAKTYSQMGEFFIAARNIIRAIEFDPRNTILYGDLGLIYFKSRNYEGSILVLSCAIAGCPVDEINLLLNDELGLNITLDEPLTPLVLNYTNAFTYVTYGSVLAALHDPPDQNYCPEALQFLAQVRAAFPDDPTLISIITESETVCEILMGDGE